MASSLYHLTRHIQVQHKCGFYHLSLWRQQIDLRRPYGHFQGRSSVGHAVRVLRYPNVLAIIFTRLASVSYVSS